MSIENITGVPGCGKTYLASDYMKNIYDKKSRLIYTNVNLRIEHDEYIQFLDIEKLKEFATKEFELFSKFKKLSKIYNDELEKKDDKYDLIINSDVIKNDKKLIKNNENNEDDSNLPFDENDVSKYINNYDDYLKASGLLKDFGHSYIVWDECQNDLEENDPVWIRFFSYHRHFNIDIVLITQDLSLIHRKYKHFIHKFYFGMNASKRFFSTTLRFKVYTDSREFKKYYIETISVKMKKSVHEFYDSGAYDVDKSSFYKMLLAPILLIISVFIAYKFLFGGGFTSKKDNEINKNNFSKHDDNISNKLELIEDYKRDDTEHLIFFNCNLETCTMRDSSFTIPLQKMSSFSSAVGMEILYSSKINDFYSLVVVSVNSSLYNDLMIFNLSKRGEKHEDGTTNFNSPNIFNK